jgi:hypothetical protein
MQRIFCFFGLHDWLYPHRSRVRDVNDYERGCRACYTRQYWADGCWQTYKLIKFRRYR